MFQIKVPSTKHLLSITSFHGGTSSLTQPHNTARLRSDTHSLCHILFSIDVLCIQTL